MARITHIWFSLSLLFLLQSRLYKVVGEENQILKKQRQFSNNYSIKIGKDMFDCIDIYKQPAFGHPLLKNHTLQLKPSIILNDVKVEFAKENKDFNHGSEISCPEGTVPIWRSSKKDLLKTTDYANFQAVLEVYSRDKWKYYGAKALMDVYNVTVLEKEQASAGLVMLLKGDKGPTDHLNAIQFGWGVNYGIHGDFNSRFFVYWTTDGYVSKGCFNCFCPGYVQISKSLAPGMILAPGKGVIKLAVHRDPHTLNWLLLQRDGENNELIGYFPKEIFNNLADASIIRIGGVVYSPKTSLTIPPMGSKVRPGHGDDICEFKQVAVMAGNGVYDPPAWSFTRKFNPFPQLYLVDTPTNRPVEDGFVVQFGGPGGAKPPAM